jgi:hypothetical protein
MKAVRLNLEDKQAWQKLQHVLTSLASDYMDLVAAEQTEFKFEQQVLSIAFTLITSAANRDRLNEFTQTIDRYFNRLQLVGVRCIEWEFYVIGEAAPFLVQGRDIPLIEPPAPLNAIARDTAKRSPVQNPKGALDAVRIKAIAKFNDTIQWEAWMQEKSQQIKRRHQRNLVRSIIEDVLILGVLAIASLWLIEALARPTFNLALLPKQHHDSNMTNVQYRCGNPAINLKNYICLARGMRYDQVASILGAEGKPLGIDRKFGDRAVIISWSSPDLGMNATFVNDKLVSRAYRQLTASTSK